MTLNLKNPEVHRVASELARMRRVSITQAVLDAVRKDLERELQSQHSRSLAEELVEIGQRCASNIRPRMKSSDHGRLLYDRKGLPK
ncbi:MAG: type II toxin-antitoxin system VapB family antitoxin [Acidobacteria bacterium]|nr:type II toxin-antitoxin system VapB family antitoxin [Acidobacteriota bacterium]